MDPASILDVTLALSFRFPEPMMMIPIVGQPPSMLEPVPMLATPFKTGEMTSQHAVWFLIFLSPVYFVSVKLILVFRTSLCTQN